jgi:predicted hotdog family 3-hydroxylacyl-ACP dehydratase
MVSGAAILQYIPQRPPMVMVDTLFAANDVSADTGFCPADDNIFVTEGVLEEAGVVEHIAQSAALHAGYQFISAGIPVPIGYIAAVKDLVIYALPKANQALKTHIEIVNKVMDFTLVRATVSFGGQGVASCEMRIFIRSSN